MILEGNCLDHLKTLEENHFDSLVTDPPAGISFMGKAWDHDRGGRDHWIAWMSDVMLECNRVMKPGAHGLVWAIPRTSHWTATALENAGFEIRDVVTHLFGSGFPKSLDVSKAMDKAAGAEREVVSTADRKASLGSTGILGTSNLSERPKITKAATDLAKQWEGWGTALKPASEHWILIRKPCSEKTVAKNVEKWGCGAINIDASRIETTENLNGGAYSEGERVRSESAWGGGVGGGVSANFKQPTGRFPANLLLSHTDECEDDICSLFCPVRLLDEQSGNLKSGALNQANIIADNKKYGLHKAYSHPRVFAADTGGASRFFYCAKASKKDRNFGCEGMPHVKSGLMEDDNYPIKTGSGNLRDTLNQNYHPTVKSTKLMEYLVTLITPPGGLVLDPFAGSGSTGVAALRKGFQFLGIEAEMEYAAIANARISRASEPRSN